MSLRAPELCSGKRGNLNLCQEIAHLHLAPQVQVSSGCFARLWRRLLAMTSKLDYLLFP